jgi:ATP-binding cassette subfamily B protein
MAIVCIVRERMKEKVKARGVVANNLYLYTLAWKIDPRRVTLEWVRSLAGYFSWTFYSVIFVKYLLSSIEGHKPVSHVIAFVLLAMGLFAILDLYNRWFQHHVQPLSQARMYRAFAQSLFDKAGSADVASYEDADFYTTYTLAIREASDRMESVVKNIPGIGAAFLAALGVAGVMGSMDPWVLLFIILPLLGNFVFGRKLNANTYRQDKEAEPSRRRIGYVNRVFFLPEYAKEIRLSRIGSVLGATMDAGYRGIIDANKRLGGKGVAIAFAQRVLTFLFAFEGVFLYGAWLAMVKKSIALSDFAVFASGIVSASWMIIGLSESVLDLMKNGLYINNLRSFLEREPEVKDSPAAKDPDGELRTIECRDVWFRYRGQTAEQAVLKGVDFTLRRGEKVAFVGMNGAGKTTFIKLLMRLYDPVQGRIILNGHDIRDVKLSAYRGLFATAFQDYRVFSMSVAENVLMRSPRCAEDYARAEEALAASGVLERVMALPGGMDAMLTREFDDTGVVLSAGEFQKIAIARVFAADFQVAILDEPSSSLDPIAEYTLYKSIMERCRDATVIFISHRLSSATLADRIVVMDDGRIIEEGDHRTLMARNGAYAEMFHRQAERYVEENYQTWGAEE